MHQLSIYTDRLKSGKIESIQEALSSKDLGLIEEQFYTDTVLLKGQAYLSSQELVLRITIETAVFLKCTICNEWVKTALSPIELYHVEALSQIRSAIFYYQDLVREAVLLHIPSKAECNGNCPERACIQHYFSHSTS